MNVAIRILRSITIQFLILTLISFGLFMIEIAWLGVIEWMLVFVTAFCLSVFLILRYAHAKLTEHKNKYHG